MCNWFLKPPLRSSHVFHILGYITSRHVRKSHQIIIIDNIQAKKGRNCMKNGKKHRSIWREMYATQYVNKWIPSWERTIMTISALYQTNTLQRDCYIAQESALSLHSDTLNRPVCNFPLILLNGKKTKTNCVVFGLTERGRTHDLTHWRRAN